MICRSQVLTAGMGDIIDINILAVCKVMDIHGIRNQKQCLEKVRKMFNIWNKNRKKE